MSDISLNLVHSVDFTSIVGSGNFQAVRSFASSNDGKKMYAGINGVTNYGIIKSTDGGASWTASNPYDPTQDPGHTRTSWGITSMACSFDGSIVYAAELGQGLYKSTDSGANWSYITSGAPLPPSEETANGYSTYNVYQIACDGTGSKLIMTTNFSKVIYSSVDGGVTWTILYTIPDFQNNSNQLVPLASNADGSVLYAAFNSTNNSRYIYKSTDNGTTWNVISTMGTLTGPFNSIATNSAGDFVFACSVDLSIFYETHAAKAVLKATNGSLVVTTASYHNGNNTIVMINNSAQTYSINNLFPPGTIPGGFVDQQDQKPIIACFKEDSTILCCKNGREVYVKVQDIRKGDLVKTLNNEYVPVNMIGKSKIYNSGDSLRGKNRLYIFRKSVYPELTEDLVLTGCHSILTDSLTKVQIEKTKEILGNTFVTDEKYRLMACLDEKAEPYAIEGVFPIWHIALDHHDYYMNYGIFANGLLVETCSQRFLKEYSGMELIE